MHVYTLVWLKSDRIGFLIVWLKYLDYSICSIKSNRILRSAQAQDFFREPEVEGWRQRRPSSEMTVSKSAIVHLVCVIIVYTIYKMYKDVASSRSLYAIFLKCQGSLLLLVT